MSGAVEVVFIPSGILENDSSHSLHYDVVLEAVSKQQAKLDTWVRDPVRLFPDHTFSPSINEMLEAALQQMPKDQPVVIPCNNDYDSLRECGSLFAEFAAWWWVFTTVSQLQQQ